MANMPKFDISKVKSNKPVIVIHLIDCSGSMDTYKENMIHALEANQKDILKLDEVNSILLLRINFNESIDISNYNHMEKFNTEYTPKGSTALYAAIKYAADVFFASSGIYDAFIESGKEPNVIVSCFSDGEDRCSHYKGVTFDDAANAIRRFNEIGATTAFIAFSETLPPEENGDEETLFQTNSEKIGIKLGFQAVKSFYRGDGLTEAFERISQSIAYMSKSQVNLGTNFFDEV